MISSPYEFNPDSFTVSQLAYRLKISRTSAYALLGMLTQAGAVEKSHPEHKRRTRYRLKPQAVTWDREYFKGRER